MSGQQPMRVVGLRSQSSPFKIREVTHVSSKKDSFSGGLFVVDGASAVTSADRFTKSSRFFGAESVERSDNSQPRNSAFIGQRLRSQFLYMRSL